MRTRLTLYFDRLLNKLRTAVVCRPRVQTRRVTFDVSKSDAAEWNLLKRIVDNLDVGVLGECSPLVNASMLIVDVSSQQCWDVS